ncbi:hypothetical protein L198_08009 [Cryptococcus wingfieldii CBS 7118]|uniref:Uncharacterized protein n=1 Tax=Cryptococcus wingfieldii CBS 7118 TaxID=1295528 RepID=A0A1E3HP17_9TREE|nr:hypothetical protein L198_08009 [Cryptococcus wingfieldii CBS 7118]ODN78090.1 hypothetical protein L198_08009 [Cryptococcus wingfieldii CBS 7118]
MYDMAYEEELRQQTIMAEVLPDAEMWSKWEKTEAPLRQGRGWYPRLDRHFLELLVISEIHALSHPLNSSSSPPGYAERVHRHVSRVRRVACERIGGERLGAYCERVKEAFEAYMMGGWARAQAQAQAQAQQMQMREDEMEDEHYEEAPGEEDDEHRGRKLERVGSVNREPSPTERPPAYQYHTLDSAMIDDEEDQSHLLEIDFKDVQLDEVSEAGSDDDGSSIRATVGTSGSWSKSSQMDVDNASSYTRLPRPDHAQVHAAIPERAQAAVETNVRLAVQA